MAHSTKPTSKFNKGPIVSSRMRKLFSGAPHSSSPVPTLETSEYKHTTILLSPIKAAKSQPWKGLTTTLLQSSELRLDDFVEMSMINTSPLGNVKKVLHAPSMGMYAIRVVTLSSREARIALVDWFKKWEAAQDEVAGLAGVRATYWNQPEGYVSVVLEYMDSGCLQSLVDSVGAVPEGLLQSLARQMCESVRALHMRGIVHGSICPTQVLLSRNGICKLDLAIKSHLGVKTTFSSLFHHFGKGLDFSKEEDIFDLGATLLTCAMGGTEWLELLSPVLPVHCCLLHTLLEHRLAPLLDRLSGSFKAFLCVCLRANAKRRMRAEDLLEQDWFRFVPSTIQVSLSEVLGVSFLWVAPSEYQNAAERQLDRICEKLKIVLMTSVPVLKSVAPVQELALDLGLDVSTVQDKLRGIYQFPSP